MYVCTRTRLACIYNTCIAINAASATPPACAVAAGAQNKNRDDVRRDIDIDIAIQIYI